MGKAAHVVCTPDHTSISSSTLRLMSTSPQAKHTNARINTQPEADYKLDHEYSYLFHSIPLGFDQTEYHKVLPLSALLPPQGSFRRRPVVFI